MEPTRYQNIALHYKTLYGSVVEDLNRAVAILGDLIHPDGPICQTDADGRCAVHDWKVSDRECPHARGRRLLGEGK